jgi:hypothetical protein
MRTGSTSSPPSGGYSPAAPFVQPPAPKGRRQPALIALGICLIGISATGFVFWSHQSSAKTPVLVLTKDVGYGEKLTTDDLKTVDITLAPGVNAVGADDEQTVVSEVATGQLHSGSILTASDISPTPPIPANMDVVALTLKQDDMPDGVTAGRQVELVAFKGWKIPPGTTLAELSKITQPPDWAYPPDPLTWKGTVVSVDKLRVTVAIAPADAVLVQQYAHNTGSLGLVLLPAGS